MARDGVPIMMLIDDEPAQRRLVSALASRAGWRTIFAADAETALAMLGTQDGMLLDAVILDQWSPDYEPSGLIRDLRAERPALPILVLTAHNNVAVAVEAMRAGITTSGCPAMSLSAPLVCPVIAAPLPCSGLRRCACRSLVRRIAATGAAACSTVNAPLRRRTSFFLVARGFGALIRLAARRRKRLISAPIPRGPR